MFNQLLFDTKNNLLVNLFEEPIASKVLENYFGKNCKS